MVVPIIAARVDDEWGCLAHIIGAVCVRCERVQVWVYSRGGVHGVRGRCCGVVSRQRPQPLPNHAGATVFPICFVRALCIDTWSVTVSGYGELSGQTELCCGAMRSTHVCVTDPLTLTCHKHSKRDTLMLRWLRHEIVAVSTIWEDCVRLEIAARLTSCSTLVPITSQDVWLAAYCTNN